VTLPILGRPQILKANETFTITFPRPAWFPESVPLALQAEALRAINPTTKEPIVDADGRQIVYWDAVALEQSIQLGPYTLHLPKVVFEAVDPEPKITRELALETLKTHMASVLSTVSCMLEGQPHGDVTADLRIHEEDGKQHSGLRLRPGKP
jgi:hypothetical protein